MVKQCLFCGRYFTPDYRVKENQKACPRPACKKARKKAAQKTWCDQNPDYFAHLYETYVKPWRKKRQMIKDEIPPRTIPPEAHPAHPGYDDGGDKRRDTLAEDWEKDVCSRWLRIKDEMDEYAPLPYAFQKKGGCHGRVQGRTGEAPL